MRFRGLILCSIPLQELLADGERSRIRARLLEAWEDLHDMRLHDEEPQIQDNSSNMPSLCNQLGFCVCEQGGLGMKSWLFHRRLTVFLKSVFVPRRTKRKQDESGRMVPVDLTPAQQQSQAKLKRQRSLLNDAFIVLKIEASSNHVLTDVLPSESFVHSSWMRMALSPLQHGPSCLWLHIGHVNFSTWAMGFLKLHEVDKDENGYTRLSVGDVAEACHSVRAFFQSQQDFDVNWRCSVHQILSNSDILIRDDMCSDWVLVKELADLPVFEFWQGWLAENAKHREEQKRRSSRNSTSKKRKASAAPTAGLAGKKARSTRANADADIPANDRR